MFVLRFLLCAMLLAFTSPVLAADKLTLILDWYVNPNHGPIIIAEKEGLFAEAGLDVEIIAPSDPSLPPKLVAAGEADLAISYQPDIHMQVHAGIPLARVGALIDRPLNCLLVLNDGPVKSIADLKGRTIGYSVPGLEEALLKAILGSANLTLDDVKLVNVNWSLAPSLMAGQVDAVIGAMETYQVIQMRLEGTNARCFALKDTIDMDYDELIFVAKADTDRTSVLRRFLGAIGKAAALIKQDPDGTWATFKTYSDDLDSELNSEVWQATTALFTSDPATLDSKRYEAMEAFMFDQGLVDAKWPYERFVLDLSQAKQ